MPLVGLYKIFLILPSLGICFPQLWILIKTGEILTPSILLSTRTHDEDHQKPNIEYDHHVLMIALHTSELSNQSRVVQMHNHDFLNQFSKLVPPKRT